jgi:hypothetical protein
VIRPPDPLLQGRVALTYMVDTPSYLAVRHLLHLAFRDCETVLDLTYGHGRFWRPPLPPGIRLLRNTLDPEREAEHHLDYTATGLAAEGVDLAIFDPPHTADNGATGHFRGIYGGTAKGSRALQTDITSGVREAWRLARIGILVKVADSSHGGEFLYESAWVQWAIGMNPYAILHTVKKQPLRDPKHRVQRVPRSNGAVYLAFRKDQRKHTDWDMLYLRQQEAVCVG